MITCWLARGLAYTAKAETPVRTTTIPTTKKSSGFKGSFPFMRTPQAINDDENFYIDYTRLKISARDFPVTFEMNISEQYE
jgi:hypothetical protein